MKQRRDGMPRVGDRVLVKDFFSGFVVSARVVTGSRGLGIRRFDTKYVPWPFERAQGIHWAYDRGDEAKAFRAVHAL